MAEETEVKPKGKKQRIITMVAKSGEDLTLIHHRTTAFSIKAAWKEVVAKNPAMAEQECFGALPGHVDWLKEKLRNPSVAEMKSMLNLD